MIAFVMKKRYITLISAFLIVSMVALSACGGDAGEPAQTPEEPPAANNGGGAEGSPESGELVKKGYQANMQKDVVTIRGVRPLTGEDAIFEQTAFGPQYRMWADLINREGGVYIKSLDRRVTIDLQVEDDGSDVTKTTQLFEQIAAGEKPDLMLAPAGTNPLIACMPIAQRYDYLLLAAEGGTKEVTNYLFDYPNTFSVLNYSETQVPALLKLFEEREVKSVYCVYVDDPHGIEYWGAAKKVLDEIDVETKGMESVPHKGDFDADSVVGNAIRSDADAFLVFTRHEESVPITISAAKQGYNPKMFLVGPGGSYDFFGSLAFGDHTNLSLDGMMSWGAWNEKSTAGGSGALEYSRLFREYWTEEGLFWQNVDGSPNDAGAKTVYQDWWNHICYYSALQVMQQAIENAGELTDDGGINNLTLIEYIKGGAFKTAMHGSLRFTNNGLTDDMYLGNIGQWQDGVFEVVDADDRRTADPWYPKPGWKQ